MKKEISLSRITTVLLSLLVVFAITARDVSAATVEPFDVTVTYHQTDARSVLDIMNDWRSRGVWYWDKDDVNKITDDDLKPMAYDYKLEKIAMRRAADLIVSWSHQRADGGDPFEYNVDGTCSYGENIAINYASAEDVFDGWKEEDEKYAGQGHRRAMASSSYSSIGIACVEYEGMRFWVQEFGFTNGSEKTEPVDGEQKVTIYADTTGMSLSAKYDGGYFNGKVYLTDGAFDLPSVTASLRFIRTWEYAPGLVLDKKDVSITWKSSDASVLNIQKGKLVPVSVGQARVTATVSAKGLTDTLTFDYDVAPRDIAWAKVTFPDMTYTGKALTPKGTVELDGKTLVYGKDYKVEYQDNINFGYSSVTVKGTGAYTGSTESYFKIDPKDIAEVVLPQIPDMVYTGNYIYPKFELKDGGKVLEFGKDYGFEVKNNLNINTAIIVIKGINNYKGAAEIPFNIIPRELTSDNTNIRCVDKQSYTGSAIEPDVSVTYEGVSLRKDVDFKLSFKNNVEVGTATYVITGTGHYKGTLTGTFKIIGDSEAKQDKVLAFVERIYIFVLDREPEKEGAAFWSDELWNFRRTGAEVAQGFIFSDEFAARNTDDTEFVTILYQTFFGRSPEDEGLNYWTSQLKNGTMDRVSVANGFIFSQEWADTCAMYGIRSGGDFKSSKAIKPTDLTYAFVERMYTTAMNREFDREGREYWAVLLANFELSGEDVGVSFFLSDEMVSYNLSDAEFINRLYKTFMDRESDSEGAAYWMSVLASGSTRADVVYGFTRSPEFTEKCVDARIIPFK